MLSSTSVTQPVGLMKRETEICLADVLAPIKTQDFRKQIKEDSEMFASINILHVDLYWFGIY